MKPEPKFLAIDCSQLQWQSVNRPHAEPGAPAIRFRTVMPGGAGLPSVHLTEYEPHHVEPRHRHLENEVLSIFEGELEIDGQVHQAPAVLFVGLGTLYGPLTAGPNGAKFFRFGYNETMLAEPAAGDAQDVT